MWTSASQSLQRATLSRGASDDGIYAMVANALAERAHGGTLVDVGCGSGSLWRYVRSRFSQYVGVDVARYERFPHDGRLVLANLAEAHVPLASGCADVVAAVEVIEHLENPRAFVRELVRIARPGGWVVITTPNQRSALSLLTLVVRGRFAAFQDCDYPAHLTALLDVDLLRIARECGLHTASLDYSRRGRIPMTPAFFPPPVSRLWPRAFSDNLLMAARVPAPEH